MCSKIVSGNFEHVVWFPEGSRVEEETIGGGWYFFDEVGLLGRGGPYLTEVEANDALREYAEVVLHRDRWAG